MFYFLTGESENYNRKSGVFDRVTPYENFFLVPGENGNVFGAGRLAGRRPLQLPRPERAPDSTAASCTT